MVRIQLLIQQNLVTPDRSQTNYCLAAHIQGGASVGVSVWAGACVCVLWGRTIVPGALG